MNSPFVSIIIATFNSEKLLPKVLEAVKKQTYPKDKIEILIIDGGSKDKTLKIAKQFGCKVLNNPRTEPVYGKFLGYLTAKGQYIMYLDHDEVIENVDSISIKVRALKRNSKIKAVAVTGYKSPKGYPFINSYINEFGDPFSFFIYRLSKDEIFFSQSMREKYPVFLDNEFFTIFNLSKIKTLPIIELVAAASMFDGGFLKKSFPETLKRPELLPHYFYLLYSKYPYIAITKNDALIHYSADNLKKYLNKIKWRVKNNIYHVSDMGESGFSGRNKFQPSLFRLKKYLFIPYAYSLILPLLDSISLMISRKKPLYLLHLPLTVYTATLIVYHYFLKMSGKKPVLRSYDDSKAISSGKTASVTD